MRLIVRCSTTTDLESTLLEPRIGWLIKTKSLQLNTHKAFFTLEHNIHITRALPHTVNFLVSGHPSCTTMWSLTVGGLPWEKSRKRPQIELINIST